MQRKLSALSVDGAAAVPREYTLVWELIRKQNRDTIAGPFSLFLKVCGFSLAIKLFFRCSATIALFITSYMVP